MNCKKVRSDNSKKNFVKSKSKNVLNRKASNSSFRTFKPTEDLLYCFIDELDTPTTQKAEKFYDELFGIKNAFDIQRFRYYPGTNKICTFFGFTNPVEFSFSMQNSEIKKAANDQNIYLYPFDKPERRAENFTEDSQHIKASTKSTKIINTENNKIDSSFKVFAPSENLLYCFIDEIDQPNSHYAEKFYNELFGIKNAFDIQRFRYLPGTNKIYTFIGFIDPIQFSYSINNSEIKKFAINHKVYLYPFDLLEFKAKYNTKQLTKNTIDSSIQ